MTARYSMAVRGTAVGLMVLQALAPAVAFAQTSRAAPPAATTPQPAMPPATKAATPASGAAAPIAPVVAPKKGGGNVDRRLALVVGNNDYKSAPLVNPINDARLVAKTLEGLGFEVMLRENLNLRDFKAVMRQFAARLENEEGSALLYYAGHGVQIEGRNFLVPVDVRLQAGASMTEAMIDMDTILAGLDDQVRTNILILDACRNNPMAPQV
ncbi:MAG: caspase family protein, partial [Betaproteobacteria bacterium]